jgi:serine/threonine protein kinase
MIKSPENEIKVIDYDFAQKVIKGEMSKFFGGTRGYLSPEQISKTDYSLEKNQVWQLGVVLYQLYYLNDNGYGYSSAGYLNIDDRLPTRLDMNLNRQRKPSRKVVRWLQMALMKDADKRPNLDEILVYFEGGNR